MRRFVAGLLIVISALSLLLASTSLWTRRHTASMCPSKTSGDGRRSASFEYTISSSSIHVCGVGSA